jgi:hypothetical protein
MSGHSPFAIPARWGTKQTAAYTGTAGTITNPVGGQTYRLRLITTSDAYVLVGDGTAATSATGAYLPALSPEYVICNPGQKVSAVQVSAGGTLEVVECV